MNPQLTPEAVERMYSDRDPAKLLDVYDRITSPSQRAMHEAVLKLLECRLGGKGSLLDFGCGPAFFVEDAQRRGWNAHGVDLGAWSAVAANRRGVANVHVGRIDQCGLEEQSFDVVACLDVVEHLLDPKRELAAIGRYIKPGGWLLVQVPNYASLSIRLGRDDFRLNEPPQHVNFFTPRSLSRLLELSGFAAIDLTSHGGLKLENIFGLPYKTDITEGAAGRDRLRRMQDSPVFTGRRTRWKRALDPLVETLFYRWAKIGTSLRALAQRSRSSNPH